MEKKYLRQSGKILLETMVGLAIALLVGMFIVQLVRNSTEVEKLIQSSDVLADLENQIRFSVSHPGFRSISVNNTTHPGNRKLAQCLTVDRKNCPKKLTPFKLWRFTHQPITGSYSKDGAVCTSSCPITIKTQFLGRCKQNKCDVARLIRVSYQIYVEGNKVRSGVVNRIMKFRKVSDDNNTCDVDKEKRPKFVQAIDGSELNCQAVKPKKAKLAGIVPGKCVKGKEVLVGINKATKEVICEKARFK